MHNNAINTPAQDLENEMFSSLRATNEWDMGRPKHLSKFIDYKKIMFEGLQPLGLMFRTICVVHNAITILDHNSTGHFYDCDPPDRLVHYFI